MSESAGSPDASPRSSWSNPAILTVAVLGFGCIAIGLTLAIPAHDFLQNVTWDGNDVDAKRAQQQHGQVLVVAGAFLALAWLLLLGTRHEANRVLSALAKMDPAATPDSVQGLDWFRGTE